MENLRVWKVWFDSEMDWLTYTEEELNEYFNFVEKPTWNKVREICVHDGGYDCWLEIIYERTTRIYNKVFGTFVAQ